MKYSTIYRRAAQLVDKRKQHFACHAINKVQGKASFANTPATASYLELFELGDGLEAGCANLHELLELWFDLAEAREWRVWMLLFAAQLAKDEGN
jgi:hypothetical protein